MRKLGPEGHSTKKNISKQIISFVLIQNLQHYKHNGFPKYDKYRQLSERSLNRYSMLKFDLFHNYKIVKILNCVFLDSEF